MPKTTILVANFNGAAWLERSLLSALAQTVPQEDYRVVVADDGSTDGSKAILERYAGRVRTLFLEHGGLPAACNAGIRAAETPYLIRLDADDEFEPSMLAETCPMLDRSPAAAFVTTDRTDIESATDRRSVVRVDASNMYDFIAPGALFRRDALLEAGLYDRLYWEEYDLFLRIRLKHEARHVSKPLYRYYRHAQSMTANPENRRNGWKALINKWGIEKLRLFGRCAELEEVFTAR